MTETRNQNEASDLSAVINESLELSMWSTVWGRPY